MKNQPNPAAVANLLAVIRAWKERRLCHALIVTQVGAK